MTHFKLLTQLERDIRNQVVIDQMKRLNRKQKFMVFIRRYPMIIGTALAMVAWVIFSSVVFAEDAPKIPCPDTQPCKVLVLTQQEENILAGKNGILDTAAQGRSLELGQFAVYFKQKLATAPAGEVVKAQEQAPKGDQSPK